MVEYITKIYSLSSNIIPDVGIIVHNIRVSRNAKWYLTNAWCDLIYFKFKIQEFMMLVFEKFKIKILGINFEHKAKVIYIFKD